jgi:hypothetical protein
MMRGAPQNHYHMNTKSILIAKPSPRPQNLDVVSMLAYPSCSRGPDAAVASPGMKFKSRSYRVTKAAQRVRVPATKRRHVLDF